MPTARIEAILWQGWHPCIDLNGNAELEGGTEEASVATGSVPEGKANYLEDTGRSEVTRELDDKGRDKDGGDRSR
ncbi:hypothetical protein DENSPDRAFT_835389 [Dentipellis sp. KUC8613]|nr:hypothetical protein DENSPDRAFT_835389 [Dentipellis sp. KUC8613]